MSLIVLAHSVCPFRQLMISVNHKQYGAISHAMFTIGSVDGVVESIARYIGVVSLTETIKTELDFSSKGPWKNG